MSNNADSIPDTKGPVDRGESLSLMEPVMISATARQRANITDLAVELAARSAGLHNSLPSGIRDALATLVRTMNCYYSNLIEGHHTHPIDIERALKSDFSSDAEQRNLQLEAAAHIAVQTWIDTGGLTDKPTNIACLVEIHERFCQLLPDELLWVDKPSSSDRLPVIPGKFRAHDVAVGRHVPISAGAIPRFLRRFEDVFSSLGRAESIIAAAAAHHRLLWIHPFLDGNGRVARLMSHAMLLQNLETGSLWSVSRGLARQQATYKGHLNNCDLPRRNALDGRGRLSEEALVAFTTFFLENCLDQVTFMEGLVQPAKLRARIRLWAEEEQQLGTLPAKAILVLDALLYRGELPRGEIAGLLGSTDRHARRIVQTLSRQGVITAESARAPLRLAFPAALASRWMPGLFPE